jgi:hypothetical protein
VNGPLFEIEDLRPLLRVITEKHPDRVNPLNWYGGCAYAAVVGTETRHCLIAQMAVEQQWQDPGPDFDGNAVEAAAQFGWPVTDEAAVYLVNVQRVADGGVGDPCTWDDDVLRQTIDSDMGEDMEDWL